MINMTHGLLKLEALGNKLPHPTLLFIGLIALLVLLSAGAAGLGWSALHPLTGDRVYVSSLTSSEGVRYMLTHMVSNFTGFAPLGPVLVAMLGLGIAERSGLLGVVLKRIVLSTRGRWLSFIVTLAGVLSSLAADAGYVVLIPLAAALFLAADKPPLAGMAAAFMGVSGGYSANLLVGPVDVILSGLSTEAAQIYQPGYTVTVTANYYFMVVSTLFIALLGAWITEKVTIPFLCRNKPEKEANVSMTQMSISKDEKRALNKALFSLALFVALVLMITLPEGAALRDQETGSLLRSPFVSSIVVIIALAFAIAGYVYGRAVGSFRRASSLIEAMEETMSTLGGYIVLMFFAAQLVALFNYSQMGLVFAINGAEWLSALALPKAMLLILFLLLVSTINLFIGSASAKWALLAPVFVPMLMILDISPEWTQLTYRIGDSATNIITPLMPYFALVVAYMQRYQPDSGIGTLLAIMLPYSVSVLCGWSLLLLFWRLLALPLGP